MDAGTISQMQPSSVESPQHYSRTAVALHWLIALLIVFAFSLGLYMHELPLSPSKLKLYSYHKWIGVTVFVLAVLRLLWRLRVPPPSLPKTLGRWSQRAAHATHYGLYLLILIVPLSGWLLSSASGFPTVWFGVVQLPDLIEKSASMAKVFKSVHEILNDSMLMLVLLHVLASLKHHFLDRDTVLRRMFVWRRS